MNKSQLYSYKCFDVLAAFYAAILVVSNIASSAKIVDMGFSLFGIRLAFDGGTLLFPFVYVLGDILTEVYGFKAARRVIWTGFVILAFSSLVFFVLNKLPAEPLWEDTAGNAAFTAILGGMSFGGIVLASLAAYLTGEFFNAMLHSKIKVMMQGRRLWFRTIASSLAGELLDSLLFVSIACLTGVFAWELFFTLLFTNYVLKCLIEALVLPLTYAAVRRLKKLEGIDTFDTGISYRIIG